MSDMDPEFAAMDACTAALKTLDLQQRTRVLDYLASRFRPPKPTPMFQPRANPFRQMDVLDERAEGAKP